MFAVLIDLDGTAVRGGVCRYPEAYISKVRSEYPCAEFIWCFSFRTRARARNVAVFFSKMKRVDINYWLRHGPDVISQWVDKISQGS